MPYCFFFKYVQISIEDHELLVVVVVNTSTISNITITVECFFSKSILPIVVFNIQEIHEIMNIIASIFEN